MSTAARRSVLALSSGAFLACVVACAGGGSDPVPVTGSEPVISAEELYGAYDSNAVNADQKLKGKSLGVRGRVEKIDRALGGDPQITLSVQGGKLGASVECLFPKSEEAKVAAVTKGSEITVVGVCDGLLVGSVIMRRCTVK